MVAELGATVYWADHGAPKDEAGVDLTGLEFPKIADFLQLGCGSLAHVARRHRVLAWSYSLERLAIRSRNLVSLLLEVLHHVSLNCRLSGNHMRRRRRRRQKQLRDLFRGHARRQYARAKSRKI